MPRTLSLSRRDFLTTRTFKRASGTYLSLAFGTISSRTRPGGAVVVSKKVEKRAVGRARIKRSLRPLLRTYLSATDRYSVIVMVRKSASTRLLREDLKAVLARIPRPL